MRKGGRGRKGGGGLMRRGLVGCFVSGRHSCSAEQHTKPIIDSWIFCFLFRFLYIRETDVNPRSVFTSLFVLDAKNDLISRNFKE